MTVTATKVVASGTCGVQGDNLTWTLDDAGTLTIDGVGEMENWNYSSSMPWYWSKNTIKSVVVGDSVTSIGRNAFTGCDCLTYVYYAGSEDDWNSISILGGNIPLHNANIHYNFTSQPQFVIGDMNGDGRVTPEDAVILSRHLAKWTGYLTLPVEGW